MIDGKTRLEDTVLGRDIAPKWCDIALPGPAFWKDRKRAHGRTGESSAAIGKRFAEVGNAQRFAAVEIRNGACHAQGPVQAPAGQLHPPGRRLKALLLWFSESASTC